MSIEAMKQMVSALESRICSDCFESEFCCAPVIKDAIKTGRQAVAEAEKQQTLQALHEENERLGLYEQDEPMATAWDEGYRAGINDERMSEANIGIAGFGAKVEPARNNPYHTHPQPRKPLTDEQIVSKAMHLSGLGTRPDVLQFARAIEAAHGIKE